MVGVHRLPLRYVPLFRHQQPFLVSYLEFINLVEHSCNFFTKRQTPDHSRYRMLNKSRCLLIGLTIAGFSA